MLAAAIKHLSDSSQRETAGEWIDGNKPDGYYVEEVMKWIGICNTVNGGVESKNEEEALSDVP